MLLPGATAGGNAGAEGVGDFGRSEAKPRGLDDCPSQLLRRERQVAAAVFRPALRACEPTKTK